MIYLSSGPAWHLYCQHLLQLLTWTVPSSSSTSFFFLLRARTSKEVIMRAGVRWLCAGSMCVSVSGCVLVCQCLGQIWLDQSEVQTVCTNPPQIQREDLWTLRALHSMSSLCCEHVCCGPGWRRWTGQSPFLKGLKGQTRHMHTYIQRARRTITIKYFHISELRELNDTVKKNVTTYPLGQKKWRQISFFCASGATLPSS